MKTLSAAILLGLSVGLLNPAVAGPFNERGEEVIPTLPAGSAKPHQGAVIPSEGFKERGKEVSATLPAGSAKPHQGAVIVPHGFNDRGGA